MSASFDTYQKRRLRSSYFSVILSIGLVLFMLGILGLILLKSKSVANHFKEKTAITLFLKDNVETAGIKKLEKSIKNEAYAKKVVYTTKEEAAKKYSKELGEDFLSFLGTNPLKNSLDIYLNASFVSESEIEKIITHFNKNNQVLEVVYDKPLVGFLSKNIQKISFWLLVISAFLGVISMLLINSSIRLSVYSKRFNIKTMQMVGATKGFIRKPFIWQGIRLGIIAALLAIIGVILVIIYLDKNIEALNILNDYLLLSYLFGGIFIVSFLITWLSTYFATQRFLNLQTDELYY